MLREVCSNAAIGFMGSAGALVAQEGIMALVGKVAKIASIGLYPANVAGALVGGVLALIVINNLRHRIGLKIESTYNMLIYEENSSVLIGACWAVFLRFIAIMERESMLSFYSLPVLSLIGGIIPMVSTALDARRQSSTS